MRGRALISRWKGVLHNWAIICSMEVIVKGQNARCQKIPHPRQQSRELLEALPCRKIRVVTRKNFLSAVKANKYKAFTSLLFSLSGVNIRYNTATHVVVLSGEISSLKTSNGQNTSITANTNNDITLLKSYVKKYF